MLLLQRMKQRFTSIDSTAVMVLFNWEHEVVPPLTHCKLHCTASFAFIIRCFNCLPCLPGLPAPLSALPSHKLSMHIKWCSTKPFGKSAHPSFCPPLGCSL